jgi:hypothetical protein
MRTRSSTLVLMLLAACGSDAKSTGTTDEFVGLYQVTSNREALAPANQTVPCSSAGTPVPAPPPYVEIVVDPTFLGDHGFVRLFTGGTMPRQRRSAHRAADERR